MQRQIRQLLLYCRFVFRSFAASEHVSSKKSEIPNVMTKKTACGRGQIISVNSIYPCGFCIGVNARARSIFRHILLASVYGDVPKIGVKKGQKRKR